MNRDRATHAHLTRMFPGRHLGTWIARERRRLVRRGRLAAFLAVVGPGILAGLSDDDPAGITTYSVLGAKFGYEMLWVLLVSVAALIVFHDIGARMGVVTGKGLMQLVRERHGRAGAVVALPALVLANFGTLCAEFVGVAVGMQMIAGVSKYVSVPLTAVAISVLVLRGTFKRVEHVLLAFSAVFITYIVAGVLAHPDWGAAASGLVTPRMPLTRDAVLIAVAVVGTTLAPWGLTFIQSYAANKHLGVKDLAFERIDVVAGAVMTGIIGFFVIVACAATLHQSGATIENAGDASAALAPAAGRFASWLFGAGLLGASLLAAAIVPLSTAYSFSEATGSPADLNDRPLAARSFYATYALMMVAACAFVLVPGVPLVSVLVLSQALNAILLLPILPYLRRIAADSSVMGDHAMGRAGQIVSGVAMLTIAFAVAVLGFVTVA